MKQRASTYTMNGSFVWQLGNSRAVRHPERGYHYEKFDTKKGEWRNSLYWWGGMKALIAKVETALQR